MKNLQALRKNKKLTQTDLAKIMGVSTSTIAMWETCQRTPDYHTLSKLCDFFGVSFEDMLGIEPKNVPQGDVALVPVLGYVRAGLPSYAEENILGYESINEDLLATGEYFWLMVKGKSMEPIMSEGDKVLVRKQSDAQNGQYVVVLIGDDEATIKKFYMQPDGITLVPANINFMPLYYSAKQCNELPVSIVGVVKKLMRDF